MSLVKPRTPAGTLELLPLQQLQFQAMLDIIRAGFERFGYLPIETPVFEASEILQTKSGGETEKQVYFVQSTGAIKEGHAPDMALRFDLTVPLARYVAEHERELSFPFRRYQMQRVYRGERAQRGRFREFYQCDVDIIGKDSLDAAYEAELPAIIAQVFAAMRVPDFTIQINNRKLLRGLLDTLHIEAEVQPAVLRDLDRMDKIGPAAVEALLQAHMPAATATQLLGYLTYQADALDILNSLSQLAQPSPQLQQGLAEMQAMLLALAAQKVPGKIWRLNLAIARGLDYYTGTVFETYINGHEDWGSVCSGGRYDDLAGHYTRSHLPGVGISIGLTRLFDQLQAAGALPNQTIAPRLLVTLFEESLREETLALATELREAGFLTEAWLGKAKLDKQFKYADKAGHRLVLVLGPDDISQATVAIKDLKNGSQSSAPRANLLDALRTLLAG